ncbi:hypothetical protein ACGFN1_24830 [Streptomyces sp. NPDC048685]|uniref:hypothetical protein n=1 Tax=Streptomyces sp. NPDC048685 TaxID=3365584 RepID=UPI00372232E5
MARQMRKIYNRIPPGSRNDPVAVAKSYAEHLFEPGGFRRTEILGERRLINKSFNIGLQDEIGNFEQLTKRAVLVSDTLLLSHGPHAPYCHVGVKSQTDDTTDFDTGRPQQGTTRTDHYGIHCPDMTALGTWLLEAEPIIRAGLAWYLPSYTASTEYTGASRRSYPPSRVSAVDYIRGGRLIDPSESRPVKDRLVRPVLEIDLPFIDGVTMGDFSKITIDEFDSYKGFRGFLRTSFLSMGDALNSEQSQIELTKLRLEIEDQVSAMESDLRTVKRKRALGAVSATVASTAALLIAVEGSVMERVLTTLELTTAGTFWGAIRDRVENGPRVIENGKWYYVWVLSRKANSL